MKYGSKEFYEIRDAFERSAHKMQYGLRVGPDERADNDPVGNFYNHGETNNAFKMYMSGYALHRCGSIKEEEPSYNKSDLITWEQSRLSKNIYYGYTQGDIIDEERNSYSIDHCSLDITPNDGSKWIHGLSFESLKDAQFAAELIEKGRCAE